MAEDMESMVFKTNRGRASRIAGAVLGIAAALAAATLVYMAFFYEKPGVGHGASQIERRPK